jgi:hypothetical protein
MSIINITNILSYFRKKLRIHSELSDSENILNYNSYIGDYCNNAEFDIESVDCKNDNNYNEKLYNYGMKFDCLPTQLDSTYNFIARGQSAWFCYEIYLHRHNLIKYFLNNDTLKYKKIYESCMKIATLNRKNSMNNNQNHLNLIEPIFCQNILNAYKIDMHFYKILFNIEKNNYFSNRFYDNAEEIIKNKNLLKELSIENFIKNLMRMKRYDVIIIDRNNMSFIIIKIFDYINKFILVDPYISFSEIVSTDHILKYINYTNDYNIITIGVDEAFFNKINFRAM